MAKDCQGTLRGACTHCGCRMFVSDKGIRCDYCDHPAAKHQNLSSPPTKPITLQPNGDDDDDVETVETDGGWEEERDEDDIRDGMTDLNETSSSTLRSEFPSSVNLLGSYAQTLSWLIKQQQPQPPQQPRQSQPPQLSPDRRCSTPGCVKPKFVDLATGRTHDYCGKKCALEHRKSLPVAGIILPHMKCRTPGCNQQKCSIPGGSGYYDYCSISCRDSEGGGFGSQEVLSQDQVCSFPGCTRPRFVDPSSGAMKDYCGRTHAALARSGGGGTGPAAYYDGIVQSKLVSSTSPDYARISTKFQNDWVKGLRPSVDQIYEISSKNLEKNWNVYRDALQTSGHSTTVEQHYHGTTIKCDLISSMSFCSNNDCGICGISRNGFQQSRIGSNISFMRFGRGFYLAPHSSKCHDYTRGTHTHRAMLLCDVLPGKKHVVQTDQTHLVAPPQGYDSVYGQPGGNLNYPEIVIYDATSILPRYVIVYQKDGVGKIAK